MINVDLTKMPKATPFESVMLSEKGSTDVVAMTHSPLISYLIEMRTRLMKSLVLFLVVFLLLFSISNEIYQYFSKPLQALLPPDTTMIATEVASPFIAPLKITLFVSLLISLPFLLLQFWGFVAPALRSKERIAVFPILFSALALFYSGVAFCYYLVLPLVFGFFAQALPQGVSMMTDINSYLSFSLTLFLAFGLAFEIPIVTVVLILTGLSSLNSLESKRPYIVVSCLTFGMLLTPPDVVSQLLLAIPMWFLFEIGLLVGKFCERKI